MKIFFNGWFSGFFEKTNPGIHIDFFLNLFESVYGEKCEKGNNIESEILCEFDMLINSSSFVKTNVWKHTYLFSGESKIKSNMEEYSCVLWGERNNKNIINLPLFVPYIYTHHFLNNLEVINQINTIPNNDILVIISNPGGSVRNKFLEKLDKNFKVCYGGRYKNNIGGLISPQYNSQEFIKIVSQFKFIISMENSREDTYITEKVIHGLLAKTIPVYWGSERLYDYFNEERIIYLQDENSIDNTIEKMLEIKNDNNKYLSIINSNIFSNKDNKLERSLDKIVNDIKCLLSYNKWNNVDKIFCVNNPIFELEHNLFLKQLFLNLNIDNISYISNTYKHTITDDEYNKNITLQNVLKLRKNKIKKSELSLILNYKYILEDIEKNYKSGMFLIFESDITIGKDISKIQDFLNFVKNKNDFDLIHIGEYDKRIWETPNFNGYLGYDERIIHNINTEDLTNSNSDFRLFRKFYTRCTDSFLWNYNGIVKFLKYLNVTEKNYGVPLDLYMSNFFEKNIDFKHYWSLDEFFIQRSNNKLIKSTIQNDSY